MPYVPNNVNVFTAAYAGAIAGMGTSDRVPSDANAADYAGLALIAGAFAQAIDTSWGLRATTFLDVEALQVLAEAAWQDRAPQATSFNILASSWAGLAASLVAMVVAGEAYFTSQGISPPPVPGNVIVPGANKQIIFNDGGVLGAKAGFEFDKATNIETCPNLVATTNLGVGSTAAANLSGLGAVCWVGSLSTPNVPPAGQINAYVDASTNTHRPYILDEGGLFIPMFGAIVDTFSGRPLQTFGASFVPKDGGFIQYADGPTNTNNWYNLVGGMPLKQPPASSVLSTQTNFGTSFLTDAHGCLVYRAQVGGVAGTPNLRLAGKSITTLANAGIRTQLSVFYNIPNIAAPMGFGVYFRESGTGKILSFSLLLNTGANPPLFVVEKWTSPTVRTSFTTYFLNQMFALSGVPIFFKMYVATTDILVDMSVNGGQTFLNVNDTTFASVFTVQPNEMGICAHVEDATAALLEGTYNSLEFTG